MDYFQLNSSMFKHLASGSRRELRRLYVFNSYFKFVANWENCFKYFLDLIKEKCFWTINRVFIFFSRYRRFLVSFPEIDVSAFSTFFVTRRSKLDARVISCSIGDCTRADGCFDHLWSPFSELTFRKRWRRAGSLRLNCNAHQHFWLRDESQAAGDSDEFVQSLATLTSISGNFVFRTSCDFGSRSRVRECVITICLIPIRNHTREC